MERRRLAQHRALRSHIVGDKRAADEAGRDFAPYLRQGRGQGEFVADKRMLRSNCSRTAEDSYARRSLILHLTSIRDISRTRIVCM